MFEDIMNAIKGERQLTFHHWRYRLLHWTFGIHSPTESDLPKFLYTHYCPLFHFTNILAVLLPLILMFKFGMYMAHKAVVVIAYIHAGYNILNELYKQYVPKLKRLKPKSIEVPTEKPVYGVSAQLYFVKNTLYKLKSDDTYDDFVFYCQHNKQCVISIEESELKRLWDNYKAQVALREEKRAQRQKKLQATIVFWVNLSKPVVKTVLILSLLGLLLLVLYCLVVYVIPGCIWFMIAATKAVVKITINWKAILEFSKWVLGITAGVCLIVFSVYKFVMNRRVQWFASNTAEVLCVTSAAPFLWLKSMFIIICEFCAMFYAENCPPIKIVDIEE